MRIFAAVGCLVLGAAAVFGAEPPDMLIVTPKDLVGPAGMLAAHRGARGLAVRIEVAEEIAGGEGLDPERIRGFVRSVHAASNDRLRFLLLMGDAPRAGAGEPLRIPPKILAPAYADTRWPYDKEIASDTWYGMMDDDGDPDLCVGRLPADDEEGAGRMVARIVAYETSADFGSWRKQLNIIAGTGGFGPMVDLFLEATFRKYMTELLDPAFDVTLTYGNPRSPYCYPPPRFSAKVVERINAGSLVTAYVGHGSPTRFDSIRWGRERFPILDADAARALAVERGSPVVVILACSTGQFDLERADAISEVMLARDRGPVAVLSSTRISHPYANGILGRELVVHLMNPAHKTLGEAILAAKKAMRTPQGADQEALDRFAALIMKPETLAPCREDHVHLYTLFGDPAMSVAYPRAAATLQAPGAFVPGAPLAVSGRIEGLDAGTAVVTLEARRGVLVKALRPLEGLEGAEAEEAMAANWAAANDLVVARAEGKVEGGAFRATLAVPGGPLPPGDYVVKVYGSGAGAAAAGCRSIRLEGDQDEEDGF